MTVCRITLVNQRKGRSEVQGKDDGIMRLAYAGGRRGEKDAYIVRRGGQGAGVSVGLRTN